MFPSTVSKFSKDLGYGTPFSSIFASVVLTVCIFFYFFILGSFFGVSVYPLENRVTYVEVFEKYIVNEYVDFIIVLVATAFWFLLSIRNRILSYCFCITYGSASIILATASLDTIIFHVLALVSLPLISGVILYCHIRKNDVLNFDAKLTMRYISLAVIAMSVIGVLVQVPSIFPGGNLDTFIVDSPPNQLFLLISSYATIYIFLLVFCLPVKVLYREVLKNLKLNLKEDINQTLFNDYRNNRLRTKTKIVLLLVAMFLAIILALIPQHPPINPDNQDIGVDTHYYVRWIGELVESESASDFAYQSFVVQGQDGDRPLSLIFMFLIYQAAGGDLSQVIEYFPIILGPGIVLALYFLTLEVVRNEKIALIAALLGAVSSHTLAGIYAGFYANWLALIVGYISIVFLFRYLRSGYRSHIIIFLVLLIGVLLLHVYTWTIVAAVAGIFLLTMLVMRNLRNNNNNNDSDDCFTNRRIIWLLLFAILPTIVVDLSKVFLTSSSGGVEQDIELAQTGLGIHQFNLRWEILNVTMHHSLGGVFSNFIILILGLFWVLKSNLREPASIFVMIFLSVGIVPLFFGSWAIQARVFYDIPFEIPAAIALYYLSRRSGSMLVSLAACTWLASASLFTVMNFYLVPFVGMR